MLDFGTKPEWAPNLDVFSIQRPTSVPIFTTFSHFEQLFHASAVLLVPLRNDIFV